MTPIAVVLGDQLFEGLPGLPPGALVFMREDWGLCTRTRHHKQKVVLFLSAMRHFAEALRAAGREVVYQPLDSRGGYGEAVEAVWRARGRPPLVGYRPADRFFLDEMGALPVALVESPGFLTSDDVWAEFRRRSARGTMGDFYTLQRRALGLLIEGGGPVGGSWSFDAENRKPMPKGLAPPPVPWVEPDATTLEVVELVERLFPDHPGDARAFRWPVTRKDALGWLDHFTLTRLADFGPYEDALSRREATLWHSLLSPLLNCGLLTPGECVSAAIRAYEGGLAPLNSTEGFVRQIVGWREFVKRIADEGSAALRDRNARFSRVPFRPGDAPEERNFMGHTRRLGPAWWDGTTGLPPFDEVVSRLHRVGWCHHIERLMVAGSLMVMCEVHPQEAYRWFMELFVDSADWVMGPNVFGMSQFSDGGSFATKPYVSGSAYVLKMSDYPRGPWCDVWDGLYWRFVDRNREWLGSNPRTSQAVRAFGRLEPVRRDRVLAAAEGFVGRVTLTG